MKSPIQLVWNALETNMDSEEFEYLVKDLLLDERKMVADAWIEGNKQRWKQQTDSTVNGYEYYDAKYT